MLTTAALSEGTR